MSITQSQKTNVLLLAGGQGLFTIVTITIMTLSSVIGRQLAPWPELATLPAAMMMFATVLTTLPASLLMKRIGRRRGFVMGAINGVIGGLVCFLGVATASFTLFCLGNFFIGLYQSFAMYYRFAAADVTTAEFRSRAVSYVMTGGVIAAVLGPINARLTLDWVPAVPYGGPFLVILALSLLAAFLVNQIDMPEPDLQANAAPPAAARPLRVIATHPGFIPAVLCSSICFSFMALYITVTPLAMKDLGFSMTDIAVVTQTQVLAMFGPSFITGALIARIGLNRILFSGVVLMTLAGLIGAFSDAALPGYIASRLALGLGWNFLFVGGAVLLSTTHNAAERGKVQGINDQAMFILVTIGCLGAATFLSALGWRNLNLAAIAPVLLVGAALTRMVMQQRRLTL